VTGDIGSGKSTLRALIEDHVAENENLHIIWPEFFDMKMVSPMQIAQQILDSFGAHCPGSAVRRGKAVRELLARLYSDGDRVAIAFDEIHRANDAALSSLKNFLEMSSGGFQRYLGVILLGQPQFEARLRDHKFRELVERIVPLRMPDFSDAAADYLAHRLKLVGVKTADIFDADAVEMITRQSTTPLQLGNIANEALRISKRDFKEKKVLGAAIKTKMFFETKQPQAFRKRPVSPVVPGKDLHEIVLAEDQPEYENMPVVFTEPGVNLSRWELTTEERDFVAKNGYIYLSIWTFGQPQQPVLIEAKEPEFS
jgi:type II secretory pathway predicted ATPase ExeA